MSGPRIVLPDYPPVPVSPEAKQRIRERKRAWEEHQAEIRKRSPGWFAGPPRSLEGMKPNLVYVVDGLREFPMGELVFLQCSSCDYEACEDNPSGARNAQLIWMARQACPQCYPGVR